MEGRLAVDYLGNNTLRDVVHPLLSVTNIVGSIQLPTITFTGKYQDDVTYSWEFTVPVSYTKPFFYAIGLEGCDYYFTPIDETIGKWKITVVGHIIVSYLYSNTQFPTYVKTYSTPVTNENSKIFYGYLRG